MEITREADYAVRCVLYLARDTDNVSSIEEISSEMNISKTFVAKILQKLAKSGIVSSFRGVRGGFRLAKTPERITLLDVIESIEGPVTMNRCTLEPGACDRSGYCTVHPVWLGLREKVSEYLASYDFSRLMDDTRQQRN